MGLGLEETQMGLMEVLLCGQCEFFILLGDIVLCIYTEKSLTSNHLWREWGHMSGSQTIEITSLWGQIWLRRTACPLFVALNRESHASLQCNHLSSILEEKACRHWRKQRLSDGRSTQRQGGTESLWDLPADPPKEKELCCVPSSPQTSHNL